MRALVFHGVADLRLEELSQGLKEFESPASGEEPKDEGDEDA